MVITITFDANTDPDIAQVQVQNKLQLALPLLPPEVQRLGVGVAKSVSNFLMFAAFVSTDGSLDASALGDYVASSVQEQISRVPGVGDVSLFGAQYAMRIWLNPDQLASYQLTAAEVTNAVQAQNAQVSAGQLGGLPAVPGQQLNATITAQTRLQNAEEFGDILLRVNQDGSRVRLRDVARIELDGENFVNFAELNGKPVAALGIKLTTGANALDTANRVKGRIKELSAFFPSGLNVEYPYETTPFVRLSIEEVVKTLIEAIALVFVVMFLFLQSFRATLIPTIAVPVVLLGTFGVLAAAGFTINTLTMFAMVLAIGLLVDDAIVVVENVERVMSEEGLPPKEATRKSMDQITGALVGIAMVLAAVFVPMAFFGGSVGVIYRQFSITLVSAMALSVLVAIILTPALCVTLLKPSAKGHGAPRPGFFGWFNRTYDRGSARYQIGVRWMLQRGGRTLLVYAAIVAALAVLFVRLPGGFLPDEDQGNIFLQVQLPPGATMESTADVLRQLSTYLLEQEADAVESVVVVRGFNFSGRGQNAGLGFVKLKDWNVRKSPRLKAAAVARRAMGAFSKLKGAVVFAFTPPAVQELGNASGFDLELLDRGGAGHAKLIEARNQLLGLAARSPVLAKVRPNGLEDTPDYRIDVDRQKASALGLSLGDVNRNLSATWGSAYVNDFIDRGRVKKVYLQADAPYRMQPQDVDRWYVRNAQGGMVPFSAFSSGRWTYGSPKLERYNGVPSVEILGEPAPGKSTGEAMDEIEKLMKQLPAGIGHAWTGLSYEERLAGSGTTMNFQRSLPASAE